MFVLFTSLSQLLLLSRPCKSVSAFPKFCRFSFYLSSFHRSWKPWKTNRVLQKAVSGNIHLPPLKAAEGPLMDLAGRNGKGPSDSKGRNWVGRGEDFHIHFQWGNCCFQNIVLFRVLNGSQNCNPVTGKSSVSVKVLECPHFAPCDQEKILILRKASTSRN